MPEKNYLPTVGWEYEGIAWQAPNSGQPVYRLYNPYSGDHHYTMAQSEINSLTKIGWRYEGLSFILVVPSQFIDYLIQMKKLVPITIP